MADGLSVVGGIISLVSTVIRLASTIFEAELDIITLEIDDYNDKVSRIADGLSTSLEGRSTRTLSHAYQALSYTWGDDSHDQLDLNAETLLKSICDARATREEAKRPIIFVGHGLGGLIIRNALAKSKRSPKTRAILKSTTGIVLLDSPLKPRRIRREEIPIYLSCPKYPEKTPFIWWILCPHHHLPQRMELIFLLAAQLACIFIMANYCLPLNDKSAPRYSSWTDPTKPTWVQGLLSHSGFDFPAVMTQPGLTAFVFAYLAYGIFAMTIYNLNTHHIYQQPILVVGLMIGALCFICFNQQNASSKNTTTIIPLSITFALVLSTLVHSVAGERLIGEEEKVLRVLDGWAEGQEGKYSELSRHTHGSTLS